MNAELRTTVALRSIAGRRPANEDAAVAVRLPDGRELIAVADGMGGHQAGEVASKRALETLVTALRIGHTLSEAFAAANDAVYQAAQHNADWTGMGTTLVALLRSDRSYEIANVGDSRAYRITGVGIQQVTRDHCLLAEAVAAGGASADAVRNSRWKNALTRSLGADADVKVDLFGPFDLRMPHTVLLCTDGLHGVVPDATIRTCLTETPEGEEAALRLTEEAYRQGSSDNITVAVMSFGDVARRPLDEMQNHREDAVPLLTRPAGIPRIVAKPSPHDTTWLQRLRTHFS